jgi:hypothetical protein
MRKLLCVMVLAAAACGKHAEKKQDETPQT